MMITKNRSKTGLKKSLKGWFLGVLVLLSGFLGIINSHPVLADPVNTPETTETTTESGSVTSITSAAPIIESNCKDSLGEIGWLVCPTTGKVAEATDWLYEKIEDILVINPVPADDGSPIYEIWKYCRGITNVVFIIFLLIVIYSQITGMGINNYGVKRALPKLITAAILVNISFLICSLAVDLSNVVGNGVRDVFSSIAESATGTVDVVVDPSAETFEERLARGSAYAAMAGDTALAIGAGVLAVESGAIWMLIPVVLGALVAVVSGLITIALRQAVVALLIMISPLAMVAYILPNTEQWFKKWKDLLVRMLVFYPMFSLLFGASNLAGFAIVASAKSGFGVLLGVAVQIFPLFFSWNLMKMSGTFLGTVNSKIRGLAAGPLATNRAWADSRRQLTKQKFLASEKAAVLPSMRLRQYLSNRKIAREEDIKELSETVRSRGLAYSARKNYNDDGTPTKEGERASERQARNLVYQNYVMRHKNNMMKGLGQLEAVKLHGSAAQKARLAKLDAMNVSAADDLKFEIARGAKIEFDNATGFKDRVDKAMSAHFDDEARKAGKDKYVFHEGLTEEDLKRYGRMRDIMENKELDVHFVAADAMSTFNAQSNIVRNKFQTYMDLTAPTQDVVHRLKELTLNADSNKYIDPIIAGLRTLNMRGDTDLVGDRVEELLKDKKIKLGTYASQSLANFLMFDVKGSDPFLRRFGKYINIETAHMYDAPDGVTKEEWERKRRRRKYVTMDEYVNGEYDENSEDEMYYDENGKRQPEKPKRGAAALLQGTSFKDMERTAMANMMKRIREHSMVDDGNGGKKLDMKKFTDNEEAIWNAIMPNVIGDQFSFLSGSEQIMAFAKSLTGMKNGKVDWEDIAGSKEAAKNLTLEEKKMYMEKAHERTRKFLKGHVPNQIIRSKTDVLAAVDEQYAMIDKLEPYVDSDKNVRFSAEAIDSYERDTPWKPNNSKDPNDTRPKLEDYLKEKDVVAGVRDRFQESFSRESLEAVAKQVKKGYQGDAKDRLFKMLDPEGLYRKYFSNGENNRRNSESEDDDDDGMMAGDHSDGVDYRRDERHAETKFRINETLDGYTGNDGSDVPGAWRRVKEHLSGSLEMGDLTEKMHDFERDVLSHQYSDVSQLRDAITKKFFG